MPATIFKNSIAVRKSNCYFLIGFGAVSLSTYAVTSLQSSVNIKDGLGTTSLSVYYLFTTICSIIISPTLLRYVSPRTCLLISDLFQLGYVLANFYPEYYTLIPGAACFGIGRGLFWPSASVLSMFYASNFERFKTGNFERYFSKFNAFVFAAFESGQAFGNLLTFAIFEIGKALANIDTYSSATMQEDELNLTGALQSTTLAYRHTFLIRDICGANDCQDPAAIESNLSSYKPLNPETYMVALSALTVIHIVGIILHYALLPVVKDEDSPSCHNKASNQHSNKGFENDSSQIFTISDSCGNENRIMEKSKQLQDTTKIHPDDINGNAFIGVIENNCKPTVPEFSKTKCQKCSFISAFANDLRSTFTLFVNPQQMLLATSCFHRGSSLQFALSEMTRSYVSCIYGVEKVGVSMSLHGASQLIFLLILSKITVKIGRVPCVIFGGLSNFAVYLFCLLWIPDAGTSVWVIYGLLFIYGFNDAIFQALTLEAAIIHFPNNIKSATACWLFWASVGFLVQSAWSTSLCVKYKIYAMFGVLVIAVSTYVIAEYRHWKSQTNGAVQTTSTSQ